jgi:ABC-type ATPase involved in cell division
MLTGKCPIFEFPLHGTEYRDSIINFLIDCIDCSLDSTLFSLGAMAPTEGYATVAGRDIRTDLKAIRQDIGICLQHDCLFPDLTVREHLVFFARLKGIYTKMTKAEAEEHIDQAIRDVALFEKRNTLSKRLSGGQKRKLSVAIAFCGGSNVVLLDEPTSGMDPFSRRFTWNGTLNLFLNVYVRCTTLKSRSPFYFSDSSISSRSLYHFDNSFYGKCLYFNN